MQAIQTRSMILVGVLVGMLASPAAACTGIRIKSQDGAVIVARTLEFATDLQSNVILIPHQKTYVGTTQDGSPGLRWTSRYATVGANAFGLPCIVDGFNEKGLAAAIFFFPDYAKYQKNAKAENAVAPWEIPTYLLNNCANVQEAVEAVKKVSVGEVVLKQLGMVLPCHYMVADAGGNHVVLEYIDGKLNIHENPLGVITNAPSFDWHITNLSNYVNLSAINAPPVVLSGVKIRSLGQGSGMLGLPGDFTPPSRFVRAVAFTQSALPVATAHDGVLQAFHILNQFDIPKGASRDGEQGKTAVDTTLWTAASDLTNARYYFRTFDNSRIRMVDLKKMDLDAKEVKTIPMTGPEVIEDVTGEAK